MTEKKGKELAVVEHEFIPKHELMSEDETAKLLDTYSIRKDQLPKILKTDPAILRLGAKRRDVVKITRTSRTAGRAVYYRVVV